MAGKVKIPQKLDYLQNKPKIILWKTIAEGHSWNSKTCKWEPKKLSFCETYDLIYDEIDLKIRVMDTPENLKSFRVKHENN